ncbi:nuclear transport factor 2 family protein [Rhodococcus ruber]|uniref:nuclear transport factor 2 family protein n=1 Tax=Rhodococcus ruber TaxID=1830 RepID=UPI00111E71B0|nr:nuclear transport factor 2 family protein [Rhodococcus ruber]MDO1479396.1 nuclear transport factor 2 family protein [Rhodococcus ruber]QDC16569.1 SgcJ/EcaC family oxidoreductase [Rhodococcus ruber]
MRDNRDRHPRRTADVLEIRELATRYALAVDDHDMATLAALYTPEAAFCGLTETLRGRDAIVAYVRTALDGYDGVSVHTPHPGTVDFTGEDTARGIVPCHVEFARAGVQSILALRYHDRYVRQDGRWYFGERRLEVRYATPTTDYGTVLTAATAPEPSRPTTQDGQRRPSPSAVVD